MQASELLRQAGYGDESCERCVARLACRFREDKEFPHEVGLFLSYPPEDVKGFIDHRAGGFKCTEIYCTLWQSGLKLEQLAGFTFAKQPIRKGRDTTCGAPALRCMRCLEY